MGIIAGKEGKLEMPEQIMKEHHVIKIASGCDHLVCLTNEGKIYTLGSHLFFLFKSVLFNVNLW